METLPYENASVFHSPEFNKVVEEVLGKKVEINLGESYYVVHPDKKFKLLKINYCPDPRLECVYGGILGNKNIIKKLKGFWHITTAPGEDISEYLKAGFKSRERFTSILEFDKVDDLWMNLRRQTRNRVNKSKKAGVEIVKSDDIDIYYKILKETYDRSGIDIKPKEYYKQILDKLGDLFLAMYEGKPIAGAIYLKYNGTACSWNSCSLKEYFNLCANNYLQYHYLEWAKENGLKRFDFLTLDVPSIAEWKEGFGGERIKFYTLLSKPLYYLKKIKDIVK